MSAALHGRLAISAALYTFVMGAWALALVARKRGIDGSYLGAAAVGELLLVAQALLGVTMLARRGGQAVLPVHILYGVLALTIWPAIHAYTRETERSRQEAALYAVGSFFLWGLVMRALQTASGMSTHL